MSHTRIRNYFKAMIISLIIVWSVLAQQTAGVLRGQITDQLGAVVVGVSVTLVDAAGREATVTTDAKGNYAFNGLTPGKYHVRATAKGFALYKSDEITVVQSQPVEHNIKLDATIEEEKVTVGGSNGSAVTADPENNSSAIVLRGADLDTLPDDPEELAMMLKSLAGPAAGPNGPQIFVDGFTSSGRLPLKASIREIHINRNPFSADNDRLGYGRIDLITKPGTEKLHGQIDAAFNDESLNSRNPFASNRAPYQVRNLSAVVSGSIIEKRSSYLIALHRRETDDNAIINATILDPSGPLVPYTRGVLAPRRDLFFGPRFDFQLNQSHTLIAQGLYNRSTQEKAGIGDFSLESRAYQVRNTQKGFRLLETSILSPKVITDTRFQYMQYNRANRGDISVPTIAVLEAFIGGGSQIGQTNNEQKSWELHNYTTWALGPHTLKAGGRLRQVRISDTSPTNFGGTYTFAGGQAVALDGNNHVILGSNGQAVRAPITSIERFRRTELFRRMGLGPAEIRSLGGGASQFSIAGGTALSEVGQTDAGIFVQDDWRVRPGFTLSLGLRYEAQNNIDSSLNFAPRIAFAWTPGSSDQAKTAIRGGFGLFYDRFSEAYTLQARRFNGITQQQYIVTDPQVLDLYPNVPSIESLNTFAVPQTIRSVSDNLQSPYIYQASFSVERRLPKNTVLTASYLYARALHLIRTRNINAPLLLSSTPEQTQEILRPLGNASNIFAYESSGIFRQHQLIINFTNRLNRRFSVFANYALNWARSDTDGATTFPANMYDLDREYGRSSMDIRHRFFLGGVFNTFWGITLNPLIQMRTGAPFNITTGRDTNGDTVFTERPAFASDPNQEGAIVTRFGIFNPNPAPGGPIIPRNFGEGPGLSSINLRIGKGFSFGGGSKTASQAQTPANRLQPNRAANPATAAAEQPFKLNFTMQVQNLFNHTNPGLPIGNLSSTYFGRSNTTAGSEVGVGNSTSNRRITLQMNFSF